MPFSGSKLIRGDEMENIIRIEKPGVSFDTRINPNGNEDYEKWKREAYEKIGYKGEEHILSGQAPYEFVWKNGRLYQRSGSVVETKGFFYAEIGRGYPDILCDCGNHTFEAESGYYSLSLRCAACGVSQCVYSG